MEFTGIVGVAAIKQHKDLAATACAGKYFPFSEI